MSLSMTLAAVWFFILGLAVVPISELGEPASSLFGATSLVVIAAITWYWFYCDAARHNVRRSVWWVIGLIWPVVSTFVLIAYLFRSRGLRGGSVAALAFLVFCVFCFGLLYVGNSITEAVYL